MTKPKSKTMLAREAAHERRMTITRLALLGKNATEIAAELGVTKTRIYSDTQWLRDHGYLRVGDIKPDYVKPKARPNVPRGEMHWKSHAAYQAKQTLLLDRVREGEDYKAVGDEMKVPRSTAYAWVKAAGLFTGEPRHTHPVKTDPEWAAKKRDFLGLVAEGMPVKHAALQLEISQTTATRWKDEAGIKAPGKRTLKSSHAPIPYDDLEWSAKKACEDFAYYSSYFLGMEWPPWAVIAANTLLEKYHSPEDEYVVMNVGPGFGKTTLVTYAFASWIAARERAMGSEPRASLGHASWNKATWYAKRLRTTWTYNEKLIKAFGRFKPESNLAPWSVEELLVEPLKWEALREKEPTVTAQSYEGSILSGRYGLIIWDDLIDKRNSSTAEGREKLADWWERDAEGRLEPGGLLVLSNARFGPEDLSWQVRQTFDYDNIGDPNDEGPPRQLYTQIAFPSHAERDCNAATTGGHTGPWPNGCLLDPERGSWKRLSHFLVKNEGRFRLVWQQEDTDPMGFLAERIWFEGGTDVRGVDHKPCFNYTRKMGDLPEREDSPLLSLMSIDPSSSHYWALEHWLVYPDEQQVLLRGERSILKVHELLYEPSAGVYTGKLESYWQAALSKGVPYTFLVYEMNIQKALPEMPYFNDWAASRGIVHLPHTTTRNKTDPDSGVEMLGQLYRAAKVDLPYDGVDARIFSDQFRREACAWPEGATDDLIMCHWFPNHKLANLILSVQGWSDENDYDATPSWATRGTPTWAQSRLGGARLRDTSSTIPA